MILKNDYIVILGKEKKEILIPLIPQVKESFIRMDIGKI